MATLAILACVCSAQMPHSGDSRIVARITPEHADLGLRQPVEALLTIRNVGSESASIDLGDDSEAGIALLVTMPDGTQGTHRIGHHGGTAWIGQKGIEAGKTYSQNLLLNRWVNFATQGTYRIWVNFDSLVVFADGSTHKLRPISLVINVGERSDEALSRFCAERLNRLLGAQSYMEAFDSAQALRYVDDPIAVPYLQKAFASPYPIQSALVDGLARISTDGAIEALLTFHDQAPPAEAAYVGMVLKAAEGKVADPDLRSRIDSAVHEK